MIVRDATHAMGTRFEVVLDGDGGAPERLLRAAAEEALARIQELDRRYSRFRPDSLLAYVNTHAAERPVGVDADCFDLLAACAEVWLRSDGAFDPTVGPLLRAWGFHGEPGDVREAAARVGMAHVALDDSLRTVRFLRPGISLDLGAIAKGQALDEAAAVLRECGITRALLHGGASSVVAIGTPPGEPGWTIAVRGSPYRVVLADRALGVSAPSGRTIERGGRRLGHVLDPRAGVPTEGAALACVVGDSARDADAWSTALLVVGARPPGMPGALTSLLPDPGGSAWHVEGPDAELFSPAQVERVGAQESA